MIDILKQLTKEKQDAIAAEVKQLREDKVLADKLKAEADYERGKKDAPKFVAKLQDNLVKTANEGKDYGRFKVPSDSGKSPHGRGFHEVADPLVKDLGINFAWFDLWHTCYDYETGKEDGGWREFGIGVWWGNRLPDMKSNFMTNDP